MLNSSLSDFDNFPADVSQLKAVAGHKTGLNLAQEPINITK